VGQVVNAVSEHLADAEALGLQKVAGAAGEDNFAFWKTIFHNTVTVEEGAQVKIVRTSNVVL
jgi:hypothetical protein